MLGGRAVAVRMEAFGLPKKRRFRLTGTQFRVNHE
jgi:hypothetical protein